MIISQVARTFVTRHCADLDAARRYARIIHPGMLVASVVTDAPASFASQDKVVGAHMYQLNPDTPWVLTVNGSGYSYIELSNYQAALTIFDTDLPETTIAYAEDNSVALIDIMASANGQAPFYVSREVTVQTIIRKIIEHPYRRETCTALQFLVHL